MRKKILVIILIITITAFLYFNNLISIPCVFYELTGFYCPGCGITRVIMSLIHGEIYQAFRYNMILFLDVPVLIILYVINLKIGKDKRVRKCINAVVTVLLVITILFVILRNISKFSFLAPISI